MTPEQRKKLIEDLTTDVPTEVLQEYVDWDEVLENYRWDLESMDDQHLLDEADMAGLDPAEYSDPEEEPPFVDPAQSDLW
jgi:hypothetical protein